MELKLTIYSDRLCRKQKDELKARDFDLSTAVCEDVLNVINIDMFEGGLESLSGESGQKLMLDIIKNAYPFFVELIKEIFEIEDSEDDKSYFKLSDVAAVMLDVVKYSFTELANSLGGKKQKN